jgi:predicted nucleotidyltransferase
MPNIETRLGAIQSMDAETARAANIFIGRIKERYSIGQAVLFGSRARRDHRPDSDADIAVVIQGEHGRRASVAMDMAGIAFDVLLDTGVLVEALPLWENELEHPESFSNPALIENIKEEGIRLWL